MDNLWDDPGDLGFFFDEDPALEQDDDMEDEFYEPFPGEDE